jgi:3-deoxy-D-manno-octulosonate 8-phosphate phosphatase (KDO 8-P phosphatase)
MTDHARDASRISVLALDVDGVLTDGSIIVDAAGAEAKRFNVRDGLGVRIWQKLGLRVAILSARRSAAVDHRAAELGIDAIIQGQGDKSAGLDRLLAMLGVREPEVAYVGDDWLDVPVLRRVGYPIAVADADAFTRAHAAYVTRAPGGRGAVRETVEHLLERQGRLDEARRRITGAPAPDAS